MNNTDNFKRAQDAHRTQQSNIDAMIKALQTPKVENNLELGKQSLILWQIVSPIIVVVVMIAYVVLCFKIS
jgi:hypothetical protein